MRRLHHRSAQGDCSEEDLGSRSCIPHEIPFRQAWPPKRRSQLNLFVFLNLKSRLQAGAGLRGRPNGRQRPVATRSALLPISPYPNRRTKITPMVLGASTVSVGTKRPSENRATNTARKNCRRENAPTGWLRFRKTLTRPGSTDLASTTCCRRSVRRPSDCLAGNGALGRPYSRSPLRYRRRRRNGIVPGERCRSAR